MSNASRYGFKNSIMFNVGVFWGFFIIMFLCSIFSYTLYNLIPSIKSIMTIIGAIYILWLARKTYRSKPMNENADEKDKHTNTLMTGFMLQFVNVKVILYGITAVSTFIIPFSNSPIILILFSVLLAFIGFVSTCCWSLFGSAFKNLFIKNYKVINFIMSLLLVYCAISLF